MLTWVLLFFLCCMKHRAVDLNVIRDSLISSEDCLESVRLKMESEGCEMVRFRNLSEYDIMFRCDLPDEKRKEFWSNYVFRLSPTWLVYEDHEFAKMVTTHTICIDGATRLEAYPPTEASIEKGLSIK